MSVEKFLRHKEINPCGNLTGHEREICRAAATNYFNLPFVNVMRNIVVQEIGKLPPDEKFSNENAIIDWAKRDLNQIEISAAINFNSVEFENLPALKMGLWKYWTHILFENRYNIFYNRLVDFCGEVDGKIFDAAESSGLTFDELEREINSIAQEFNYAATLDDLTAELTNFVKSFEAA